MCTQNCTECAKRFFSSFTFSFFHFRFNNFVVSLDAMQTKWNDEFSVLGSPSIFLVVLHLSFDALQRTFRSRNAFFFYFFCSVSEKVSSSWQWSLVQSNEINTSFEKLNAKNGNIGGVCARDVVVYRLVDDRKTHVNDSLFLYFISSNRIRKHNDVNAWNVHWNWAKRLSSWRQNESIKDNKR